MYSIDYNIDGLLLATCGKDKNIRVYDEQTKSVVVSLSENSKFPGHSNRIFCCRFSPYFANMIVSGGWDNTVQIYDIRQQGPVGCFYGPHICGDGIDFHKNGHTLLTGSYRMDDCIELWDLRVNKKFRDIEWNGPKASEGVFKGMETKPLNTIDAVEVEEKEPSEQTELTDDHKVIGEPPTEAEGYSRENPAPFLYSCMFNNKQDMIMAAGAGGNQVRLFDYETGNVLCIVSDMPRPILCMAKANTTTDFAFGSVDSKIRIMQ